MAAVTSSETSSWIQPEGQATELSLINSLAGNALTPFVPISPSRVGWYICGPTVYDSSHLGHARNYLSFDIIRRVMEDYFGFRIFYVMNITDIDDKIINRTWQNRVRDLTAAFAAASPTFADWLTAELPKRDTPELLAALVSDLLDSDGGSARLLQAGAFTDEAQRQAWLGQLPVTAAAAEQWDVQTAYLELAAKYEVEFLDDMKTLGMRMPSAITRVSEYIPEIVAFIERIIANGLAYAADGNVYFDHAAFVAAGNAYAKTALTISAELLAEGEGAAKATDGKRAAQDFALWKRAKPGEPRWHSPWGEGRPGWHIECSAMASDLLGSNMDLNCGGTDLRFPHHDNQLAQSEAHFGCKQWVNYFLHTGHLHINGLKMSKSLKNFITIRNCLLRYTPRQLRLLFLTVHWNAAMEIELLVKPDAKDDEKGVHIQSARLRSAADSSDAVDTVRSFLLPKAADTPFELHIPAGTRFTLPSSASSSSSSSSTTTATWSLYIQYTVDGRAEERAWPLTDDGLLAEPVRLVAGGVVQLENIVGLERKFADFFLNASAFLRKQTASRPASYKWSEADRALHAELEQTQQQVHRALCQSIDTPTVIGLLSQLVDRTAALLPPHPVLPSATLVANVVTYVQRVFRVFGLYAEEKLDDASSAGFPWPNDLPAATRQPLGTIVDALSHLREQVRNLARTKAAPADILQLCDSAAVPALPPAVPDTLAAEMAAFVAKVRQLADNPVALLRACDSLRDDVLPRSGIRLEDLPDKTFQWKLDDPRALAHERHLKALAQAESEAQAAKRAQAQLDKQRALQQRNSIPPADFFKVFPEHQGKYSQYDDDGVPTHTADGKSVSKSARSKLQKLFADQRKRYDSWLASQSK